MENSPKLKNHSRLTLNKKQRLSDSPKTPIRIVKSPDCFSTPPSKRSHIFEESPSQDFENDIPSQDVQSSILDVGWKWCESPEGSKVIINKKHQKSNNPISFEKKKNIKNIPKNKNKQRRKEDISEEGHGFYKFRQELLKIKYMEKWNLNSIEDELDSSLKENEDMIKNIEIEMKSEPKKDQINTLVNDSTISALKYETKLENITTDDNNYNNLLDDSDTDNLLIEFSQKVETEIKPEDKIDQKKKTTTSHTKTRKSLLKEDIVINDSFDDILLSLPLDDKNTNSAIISKTPDQSKNTFNRYNSMPSTSLTSSTSKNFGKNFVRHNSMPGNEKNTTKANEIPSNSCSGAESSFNRSNISSLSEEIERRRQAAKQRLMMTMQRKLQQQKHNQMK